MALEIFWTQKAETSFDSIISYLQSEWNDDVTRAFVQRTYDLLELIIIYPELGTIQKRNKKIRGLLIVKQVTLFYRIKNAQLILLMFFDNRQHPKKRI